jgi:hypothetical protein
VPQLHIKRLRKFPIQTSLSVGDDETGSEEGVVLDTYSHVLPGMQDRAVSAMDDALS